MKIGDRSQGTGNRLFHCNLCPATYNLLLTAAERSSDCLPFPSTLFDTAPNANVPVFFDWLTPGESLVLPDIMPRTWQARAAHPFWNSFLTRPCWWRIIARWSQRGQMRSSATLTRSAWPAIEARKSRTGCVGASAWPVPELPAHRSPHAFRRDDQIPKEAFPQ